MTTRTILLTLAATLAPLYAQQPAPALPNAAQTFRALATPAQTANATAVQRARVFSALALLPQHVTDFAVLTNVGKTLRDLAESGKLPELSLGDIPAELLALDNIAIAATQASPATLALLRHALVSLRTVDSTLELSEEWTALARAELRDTITEELFLRADATIAQLGSEGEGASFPPSYIVLTSLPGEEALLQECCKLLLADLQDGNRPGISSVNNVNGFSGIRMELTEVFQAELADATRDMAPRRREQLLNELAQHPLHILARQQGNALIITLCEQPQELQIADSPEASLLSTESLAPCDSHHNNGLLAALRISPELANLCQELNTLPTLHLASGVSAAFTRLAELEPANQQGYLQAANAVNFFAGELQKLIRPVRKETFVQMWCDGDLHLVSTCDAQDCFYIPGELRLTAMAESPQTAFYAESTPLKTWLNLPNSDTVLNATLSLAEGFALTLAEEGQRHKSELALAALRAFEPQLQAFARAGSTLYDALNGQFAFVVDSAYPPLPAVSGVQPNTQAHAPRFALYAGVGDRAQLESAWTEMQTNATQMVINMGAPAEMMHLIPITEKQAGIATSYSLTLPFFTQDAVPSLAVTNTGLALGSSANLTTQVAQNATGNEPFAGAVFALRFKPLARTLRSLATALDHDAEEAEPAANSNVRLEKEKPFPLATVGSAEGPITVFVRPGLACMESAKESDAADQLSTAAAIFEFASSLAEGMYGTSTIENGQHTLHVQVKMK